MIGARAHLGAAFALLLAACDSKPASDLDASAAPLSSTGAAEPVASARRPGRRYFLGRTQARCEVYFADGDVLSTPAATPCPPDILPGERFRIAGKTCTREGPDPDRHEPVVCPDPLTNLEKEERARALDAGKASP